MTQPTTEQIIDAVIGGHPNIGTWLGREITAEAIRRTTMHRADTASPTITPTPANAASGQDGPQTALPRDTVDVVTVSTASTVRHVNGVNHEATDSDGQSNAGDLRDRVGGPPVSVMSAPDESAHEAALVAVEIEALSTMAAERQTDTDEPTPPMPDGLVTDSRPRPKGMTKLRTKVWDWIEEHSGPNHNADNLSVNKVKAGAGCARGVAGEMLALYRSWYTDTSQKSA